MKKKGTHVGVVISFLIFVTFLTFLYTIVQPSIKTNTNEKNLLNYLEGELISEISIDLTSVSVGINGAILDTQDCLNLNDLITNAEITTNIIVKNNSGNTFDSYLIGSTGLLIDRKDSGTTFFSIRISEEFPITPPDPGTFTSCEDLDDVNGYTIGAIRTEKYIFESKIVELKKEYETDYIGLKNKLKVSDENRFGFSFTYTNNTVIKTKDVNVSIDVYVEEIPIQYIDKNASIVSGLLGIRIW